MKTNGTLALSKLMLVGSAFVLAACQNDVRVQDMGDQPLELVNRAQSSTAIPSGFSLSLSSQVAAPVVNGQTLGATAVLIVGKYAYVTYNSIGATANGSLEVIDISKPSAPVIVSQIDYPNYDVNAMFIDDDNDQIYLVGATTVGGQPAYLRVLAMTNGIPGAQKALKYVSSYAANSVFAKNGFIFVTSGDHGGLSVFNASTLSMVATASIFDARSISSPLYSNHILVFGAQSGRILSFDSDAISKTTLGQVLVPIHEVMTGGATVPEAKSVIYSGNDYTATALGSAGLQMICNKDGKKLVNQSPVSVSGVSSAVNVTNAVGVNNGLVFAANGEGGLQVYLAQTTLSGGSLCSALNVPYLGQINFGTAISANDLAWSGSTVVIAAGIGGLRIVKATPGAISNPLCDFNLVFNIINWLLQTLFSNGYSWITPVSYGTISGVTYW